MVKSIRRGEVSDAKNCQRFWVTTTHDLDYIFLSRKEAEAFCDSWNQQFFDALAAWENGGDWQDYFINETGQSGLNPSVNNILAYFKEYPVGSTQLSRWAHDPTCQDAVGWEKVAWGNPATCRP